MSAGLSYNSYNIVLLYKNIVYTADLSCNDKNQKIQGLILEYMQMEHVRYIDNIMEKIVI